MTEPETIAPVLDADDPGVHGDHVDLVVDEEDDPFEGSLTIRAKWTMDGATTLDEAAAQMRSFAEYLEDLSRDGYVLLEPVQDDYGFLKKAP